MQLLVHTFWVEESHETTHDLPITHVLETFRVVNIVIDPCHILHDDVDPLVNIGHPEHERFELPFLLLDHLDIECKLYELILELWRFGSWFLANAILLDLLHFFWLDINILICGVLNVFQESWVFFRAVDELQDIHGVALVILIGGVVVHFGDPCSDVVENWEHVKTKVYFLVFEERFEKLDHELESEKLWFYKERSLIPIWL